MGYNMLSDKNKKAIDIAIQKFVEITGLTCIDEIQYYELSDSKQKISRFNFVSLLDNIFVETIKTLIEGREIISFSVLDEELPRFTMKFNMQMKEKNRTIMQTAIGDIIKILSEIVINELEAEENGKPLDFNEADKRAFTARFNDLLLSLIEAILSCRNDIILEVFTTDEN